MDAETSALARRAASRLAGDFDPGLPSAVERELAASSQVEAWPTRGLSYDAGTTIALASLILSAVQFGWTIWRNLKEDRDKERDRADQARDRADQARDRAETAVVIPPRELLLRRLRLGLDLPAGLQAAQRDRILEVVADEIVATKDIQS